MQSPHPMDRVVVGDVGFGKTEVAMRAALKCVEGGAQAAVFVPTTILADQHARTFRGRFAEYPVRTASLSRFTPAAEARRVLCALADGSVDVVVGTQRLLAKDVRFKDLGLCVIDEEQRFGVKDKERLRTLRKGVDCLTLSATPIPRTLYQALSGLRAVSLMRSAPTGRQPIATEVRPYDEAHAVSAIEAELARGGQAFFVHNRVRSLPEAVARLKARLPGARIAMAHGRMSGPELEETMWAFFRREYDVLAASSIIESGLDIPSVNTLLVEDAHEFGLAQLYQLRGRIGREKRRAYCCLYYPKDSGAAALLSEEAKSRLSALREFGGLGSGLMLAMRDLEIRGAGDLLGGRQHGHLDAVGLEYYCRLLEAEVSRLKRKGAPEPEAVEPAQLDLGVRAYLPEDYLPGDLERIEFYKRLLAAEPGKLEELRRELTELSGPPPEPVESLFRVLRLRHAATALGVRTAAERMGGTGEPVMELRFRPGAKEPVNRLGAWLKAYAGRIEFVRSPQGSEGEGLRVRLRDSEDSLSWLEVFLRVK
ncbi:MAG: DEAD/DEAH box helicase, partial [Elusimicrobiota bacterium]